MRLGSDRLLSGGNIIYSSKLNAAANSARVEPPPSQSIRQLENFVAVVTGCLWIFPLRPFMASTHVKLWCYIAEFWPVFFPTNLEILSWVRHVVCIRHWACASLHFPSHSLCKICDCPSNKYAEHISSYRNLFSIDLPLGVAQFSGLAFLIWNSKSWQCCHARWVDVLHFCAKNWVQILEAFGILGMELQVGHHGQGVMT